MIDLHWPSFLLGFGCCALTPLIDIIAVFIMHKLPRKYGGLKDG